MNERKRTITPPQIEAEDPNATKRPAPPASPSEAFKAEQAMQGALRERLAAEMSEEIEKLGRNAEALAAEREVAGELSLAEEDLRQARVDYAVHLSSLDINSEHAPAAGIEDIGAYRAWLKRRFEGLPPTEHPPEPTDEPEEKK